MRSSWFDGERVEAPARKRLVIRRAAEVAARVYLSRNGILNVRRTRRRSAGLPGNEKVAASGVAHGWNMPLGRVTKQRTDFERRRNESCAFDPDTVRVLARALSVVHWRQRVSPVDMGAGERRVPPGQDRATWPGLPALLMSTGVVDR